MNQRKNESGSYPKKVYGLSVCEDCNKSTEVVYKTYVAAPVEDYKAFIPVCNVVYKCYQCAFGDEV